MPSAALQVSEVVVAHMASLAPPSRFPDGNWTISVRLDPPELGQVQATLSLGQDGLSVVLVTSTQLAQQVLQQASHQIAASIGKSASVSVHAGAAHTGGGSEGQGRHGTSQANSQAQGDYDNAPAGLLHVTKPSTGGGHGTYILV
jgi:flagellar hook-length control protein FliK